MLIHFTGSYENIASMLTDKGLLLKYCKEDFFNKRDRIASSAVHPMVCFSDYDPDELSKTEITYGEYGIQFTWQWVNKNNISPVIYMHNNSTAASGLEDLLIERRNNKNLSNNARLAIIKIKCFTKNAFGKNIKMKNDNFNFTKEKEWRYVPTLSQIAYGHISENRSRYNKENKKLDKHVKSFPLKFEIDDIDCIYIKADSREKFLTEFPALHTKMKIANWII
ncbi:hypothetical protein EFW05_21650 [Yersinia enterocolitica]|nr:hypothetical protein [Yersinia enterocolitica]EKN5053391.1 hypothetical protein [Yersinia enterocolitica]